MRPRPALFPPDGRTGPVPPPPHLFASETEKNRGRIEHRTLETTSLVTAQEWPSLKQGFRLTREIRHQGRTTREVVHGITSLPPEVATAADLLAAVRSHWAIENQLHYVRDVVFGEDACRVRTGSGPQTLAALRNVAICLFERLPTEGNSESQDYLAARPEEAINLLFSST